MPDVACGICRAKIGRVHEGEQGEANAQVYADRHGAREHPGATLADRQQYPYSLEETSTTMRSPRPTERFTAYTGPAPDSALERLETRHQHDWQLDEAAFVMSANLFREIYTCEPCGGSWTRETKLHKPSSLAPTDSDKWERHVDAIVTRNAKKYHDFITAGWPEEIAAIFDPDNQGDRPKASVPNDLDFLAAAPFDDEGVVDASVADELAALREYAMA